MQPKGVVTKFRVQGWLVPFGAGPYRKGGGKGGILLYFQFFGRGGGWRIRKGEVFVFSSTHGFKDIKFQYTLLLVAVHVVPVVSWDAKIKGL